MRKKRLFSIVLSLCMVLALMPQIVFADTPSSDFIYSVTLGTNEVTIIKYNGSGGAVEIPEEIEGKPVKTISSAAFRDCASLTSVTIPNGVTFIGEDAFKGCTSLTSVTIPSSVTSIGESAFIGCTSLASITIPSGVQTIERNVFQNCTGLTSVTIPGSVISIGEGAFYRCTGLTSITIPRGVQTIGNNAFYRCTSLTSVEIPDSVTSIGWGAFYECTSLTSITIPSSAQTIGGSAFRNCTSLTSVTIPGSVTSIGDNVFDGCTSLASITVDENNSIYSSEGGVLFSKDKKVLIRYPLGNTATAYSIPDGITSIRYGAFNGCRSLTSVTIPGSVTSIGVIAFIGCTSLTSVTIPGSVTSIGDGAFNECTSLESIFLPDNSLSIGYVAIPEGATKVRYSLDNGKVTITGIDLETGKTGVAIPATICGYDVVAVADDELLKLISSHTCVGGTATCTAMALCTLCGEEYGELLAHDLEKIPAKDATLTETGNIEYWKCLDCGRLFADENGTNEISLADTVIQKLTPETNGDKGQNTKADAEASAKTGDNTNLPLWIALMLLSGAGIIGASLYSRRKRTNK